MQVTARLYRDWGIYIGIYIGVTVPQPTAERVSQPVGRGNIIATNLTLILVDKNQKIPARVSISHFKSSFDENTLPQNCLLYVKPFLSKKLQI